MHINNLGLKNASLKIPGFNDSGFVEKNQGSNFSEPQDTAMTALIISEYKNQG